ncbi:uncharacterized protein RSE6_03164 [Rhynchosporium secalis]|uniref:Uncharacterized protein n=1 Tax=Rhynchosporium secalis TaxID=38038 RepID=A0A1E1M229_RHYSE|nr:uncharacterized protein RSE6_03164 [Rhynchosporium secalis]
MSVVPREGLLRKHFEEAVQDIEYKSSAFWQAYFQRAFPEVDTYSVTAESSPDGSRRRVDMVVKKYDVHHHTFTALLWIECKRPTGSVREVETQALDAALRCITADNLLWIYAITTVGVSFRTWIVESDNYSLQPLHGTADLPDRRQYIYADTDGAYELTKTINLVKTQTPLRQAPVVPSQSVKDFPMSSYADENSFMGESSEQQEPYNDVAQGTEQPAGSRARGYMEVIVTRISHTFRPDEFVFKDIREHRKSTMKENWEQIQYDGEWVWAFQGKRTTYYSRTLG